METTSDKFASLPASSVLPHEQYLHKYVWIHADCASFLFNCCCDLSLSCRRYFNTKLAEIGSTPRKASGEVTDADIDSLLFKDSTFKSMMGPMLNELRTKGRPIKSEDSDDDDDEGSDEDGDMESATFARFGPLIVYLSN